jgi:RimJ/RimL family protein N-acetyltransferase
VEKDDIDFVSDILNNIEFDKYDPITQISKAEMIKGFDSPSQLAILAESRFFIIAKKDGTRIGFIRHGLILPHRLLEIGYIIIPAERGKGHATEAVKILVDYLFLSKDIVRVHAGTNIGNKASQRVLEKVGFKREGTLRKSMFVRGEWSDSHLYSFLREEWKAPKILTKTVPEK